MLELHLLFETQTGEEETLVIFQPNPDLTPKKIMERMKEICDWSVYQRNGAPYFTKIIGAKYVTLTEDPLFVLRGKDVGL